MWNGMNAIWHFDMRLWWLECARTYFGGMNGIARR